ncbi:MAG: Abi family protein [Sphaerochaeta sp.]|nr:Abi family protein [Sphaerochaeta sp.]
MKYIKEAKTFEQQADILLQRGLIVDREKLITVLSQVNYYRLTTYLYTYRDVGDTFKCDTNLDQILRIIMFDHELRTLLLDIIEGIEILVRTRLAYFFSLKHGPFAWTDPALFPNFDANYNDFERWQVKLAEQTNRARKYMSNEDTVVHFFKKYGDCHDHLPVWILTEIMDFGATLSFYRGVEKDIRKNVALSFDQPEELVLSWLLGLNTIRNHCAHHSRLWNWQLGIPVKLPNARKYKEWNIPQLSNRQLGSILYICSWMSDKLVMKDYWHEKALNLFVDFEDLNLLHIGMPSCWKDHDIWKRRC